jgi:NTE family protein
MSRALTRSRPGAAARRAGQPRIGLALGGGGARGLAHILMLEALDELGIVPSVIAGTSIGAIFGAASASGLSAALIRAHTEETLSQRLDLVRQLLSARADPIQKLFNLLPLRSALLNPDALLEVLFPRGVAADFADLEIPFAAVATDFYAQEAVVLSRGALRPAVAASMALPALFQPVMLGDRALVDGGLVNPLPFDLIADAADIIVAIDVSGASRRPEGRASPSAIEALVSSSQILQRSIVREKLKNLQPDIYVDVGVDRFHVLEFHRFREILQAAAPAKAAFKQQLQRVLSAVTVSEVKAVAPPPEREPEPVPARKKRLRLGLGARRRTKR